jgi:hypothetical protein
VWREVYTRSDVMRESLGNVSRDIERGKIVIVT